jgi:outer membrane receptor for ferrienterochelin and colicin
MLGGVVNIVTKRIMIGFIGSADLYAATPRSGYYELTPLMYVKSMA